MNSVASENRRGLRSIATDTPEVLRRRKNPCKPWGVVAWKLPPTKPQHPTRSLHMQTITTKPATAAEAILAIDLGKYKSVACLYGAADEVRFLPVTHQSGRAPRLFG